MCNSETGKYYLTARIGRLMVALSIGEVIRTLRAMEISPLPGAPRMALGIINLGGEVIPVLDFRKRLKLRSRALSTDDKMIIVRSSTLRFCFLVDEITGLETIGAGAMAKATRIIPGTDRIIEGTAVIGDNLVLIQNMDKFLSLEEEKRLVAALEKRKAK